MQKIFNPKSIILICITICFFVTTNIHWGKNKWKNIIEADAKGYYAYLPAVFIYHDLNFDFYDTIEKKKYFDEFLVYDYRATAPNGKRIDKYFCGTAIAQAPFFLIAHALSALSGNETDGYSRIYLLFITLAALFYLFVGLWYINKLLQLYNINTRARMFVLPIIVFGTNLFFYSVCEMGMSHVYSFAFVAMFCFYCKRYFKEHQSKDALLFFVLLGMIFLIRPVNCLIVFSIPFLSENKHNFFSGIQTLLKRTKLLLLCISVLLAIIGIQSIIYKISTGNFWVYSYGDESFNFGFSHFIDILFSYKKGLFLYTPIYLIALTGLYFVYKKNKFNFFTFLLFFCLITFILSSWWSWWYGGSFSSRVYVEFLPLFAIMLGTLLQHLERSSKKIIAICLIVILAGLCQFQTYQYRYYIIHWENMTKEKYWDVFLSMKK